MGMKGRAISTLSHPMVIGFPDLQSETIFIPYLGTYINQIAEITKGHKIYSSLIDVECKNNLEFKNALCIRDPIISYGKLLLISNATNANFSHASQPKKRKTKDHQMHSSAVIPTLCHACCAKHMHQYFLFLPMTLPKSSPPIFLSPHSPVPCP
jgi:hypothetical protein